MAEEGKKRLAVWLSILAPGAGHLYLGDRRGGMALLCVTVALLLAIVVSMVGPAPLRSPATAVLLLLPYAMLSVPAARSLRNEPRETPAIHRRGYLLVMLAVAGPMALPLLWQSEAFSRPGKIVWTIVVIAIVVIAVGALVVVGPMIEELMQQVVV